MQSLIREAAGLRQLAGQKPAAQAAELDHQAQVTGERARAMLTQILDLDANPRDVFSVARLGVVGRRLGNFDSAIELLERASREEPEQPWIRENLASSRKRPNPAYRLKPSVSSHGRRRVLR